MTGFNHGMTGAVIALTAKQPVLAVPLAFLSHFVQDLVPHWNYSVSRVQGSSDNFFSRKFDVILIADFLFAVILMIVLGILFPTHKWLIWGCMVVAASPDLMWAYYRLYLEHIKKVKPRLDPLANLHKKIQWSQTARGAWVEAAWFLAASAIILIIKY